MEPVGTVEELVISIENVGSQKLLNVTFVKHQALKRSPVHAGDRKTLAGLWKSEVAKVQSQDRIKGLTEVTRFATEN